MRGRPGRRFLRPFTVPRRSCCDRRLHQSVECGLIVAGFGLAGRGMGSACDRRADQSLQGTAAITGAKALALNDDR